MSIGRGERGTRGSIGGRLQVVIGGEDKNVPLDVTKRLLPWAHKTLVVGKRGRAPASLRPTLDAERITPRRILGTNSRTSSTPKTSAWRSRGSATRRDATRPLHLREKSHAPSGPSRLAEGSPGPSRRWHTPCRPSCHENSSARATAVPQGRGRRLQCDIPRWQIAPGLSPPPRLRPSVEARRRTRRRVTHASPKFELTSSSPTRVQFDSVGRVDHWHFAAPRTSESGGLLGRTRAESVRRDRRRDSDGGGDSRPEAL